jgi:hypothetical protein
VEEFNFLKISPYDLDNFDIIFKNAFLDAYEVDILQSKSKLRVHAKSGYKLMNLDADYNFMLAKMGVNLVEFPNVLPSYKKVNHKIKVVPKVALLSKASYRLKQKELEDF